MHSLGFVSRMANWLRGEHDDASRHGMPDEAPPLAPDDELRETAVAVEDPPAATDAERDVVWTEAARPGPTALAEITRRFTRATDALDEIRGGLAGLEGAFAELPEVVRAQTRFLSAITERLEAQEMHQRELLAVLRDLPETGAAQTRMLERTHTLLQERDRTGRALAGGFHRLANTMQGVHESSARHLVCLNTLTERHERYLKEQRDAFRRHNRLVVGILAITGVVALGGVILALCALLG
jgi:hypothetical protein